VIVDVVMVGRAAVVVVVDRGTAMHARTSAIRTAVAPVIRVKTMALWLKEPLKVQVQVTAELKSGGLLRKRKGGRDTQTQCVAGCPWDNRLGFSGPMRAHPMNSCFRRAYQACSAS
jgi:hypothetical protein